MENNNVTEVVFVLDKSGSMYDSKEDTIGGFNQTLDKQKEAQGQTNITTCLFSNGFTWLHDHIDIKSVQHLTSEDYQPNGCTALLDAFGESILKLENITKQTKTNKVIFFIITDGLENASKEFTNERIKKMVEAKKELGWEFVFLGANMDAFATASSMGINVKNSANFKQDKQGMAMSFMCASNVLDCFRKEGVVKEELLQEVNDDCKNRQ